MHEYLKNRIKELEAEQAKAIADGLWELSTKLGFAIMELIEARKVQYNLDHKRINNQLK